MEICKQSLMGIRKTVFFKDGEIIRISILGRKKPKLSHPDKVADIHGKAIIKN